MRKSLKIGLAAAALTLGLYTAAGDTEAAKVQKAGYYDQTYSNQQKGIPTGYKVGAGFLGTILGIYLLSGLKTIRPTEKGLVERLGKYKRVSDQGLTLILPGFDKMTKVNITEMMVDAEPQEVITKDNLNARVDAQIYFKVRPDNESVKKSQYNVANYRIQIVALARTTLRDIIGNLTLKEANSMRNKLNSELAKELDKQTDTWGIEVVRAELKEIDPPSDVQETMNKVVKAENEKIAAIDFATATETKADGERRAEIKKAEGVKQGKILQAEGEAAAIKAVAEAEAEAIQRVNKAAEEYFKGNAIPYKRLQVTEEALKNNTKYIIPEGTDLITVLGESEEKIVPITKKGK